MKKSTKTWLWVALVICVATTILNATQQRWVSVAIAVLSLIGLCLLLFKEKKNGFILMCCCNTVSCIYSIMGTVSRGESVMVGIIMSIVGSLMIPGITALFLRGQWSELK